jgi:IS30 family transposase
MGKHFTFADRVLLQYYLETNPRCSVIEVASILKKSRPTIYYELKNYVHTFASKSVAFNEGLGDYNCLHLKKFPFCCNSCARIKCAHRCREYNAYKAHDKAYKLRVETRTNTAQRKRTIEILDKTISQLIKDGQSIKVAMMSVNRCDHSESTIRRYINNNLLMARRIDLPNAVRFKPKKEYSYSRKRINVRILYKRTYQDYLEYMEANPLAKVIQIDSVIGKSSDTHALLTVFFVNSKFQLAIKYNRKHSNINQILTKLYSTAQEQGFKLFDVIIADNGTEFFNLPSLEKDDNEVHRCNVFYCDPYRSCQKAECERNHGFIRRIFRKGKSLSNFSQEEFDMGMSHINSYPRGSLKNKSPYDLFTSEYDYIITSLFNIDKIELSQVCLKPRI